MPHVLNLAIVGQAEKAHAAIVKAALAALNIRAQFTAGEDARQLPADGPGDVVVAAVVLGDGQAIELAEVSAAMQLREAP